MEDIAKQGANEICHYHQQADEEDRSHRLYWEYASIKGQNGKLDEEQLEDRLYVLR